MPPLKVKSFKGCEPLSDLPGGFFPGTFPRLFAHLGYLEMHKIIGMLNYYDSQFFGCIYFTYSFIHTI